jgi:hypothetical protein
MSVRLICVLLAAVAAGGCAAYRRIELHPTTIGDTLIVEPQIVWSGQSLGPWEMWTVDGSSLQQIRFLTGLRDGEAIPVGIVDDKRPRFRKAMSPSELAELVVDWYIAVGLRNVQNANLRPAVLAGHQGFRFELTYSSPNGLDGRGLIVGTIMDERLYLIVYSGAAEYYFPKHLEHVEALIRSARPK